MSALISLLLFCHLLGAFTGIATAIGGEFAYLRAIRDGKIDAAERAHLRIAARGLRFGMSLLLLASFALVILAYILHEPLQPALTASYWIFMTLVLLIIGLSWALARRRVSFALGSAALLAAWWLLAYLTLGRLPLSYGAAIALYVVLTAVVYVLLRSVRFFVSSLTHRTI